MIVSSVFISDMQLFDTVRVVGMTPDNVSVIEIIQFYDHDEILTPGKCYYSELFIQFSCIFRIES